MTPIEHQTIQSTPVTASHVGQKVLHIPTQAVGEITNANAAGVWVDFGQGKQRVATSLLQWVETPEVLNETP